MAEALSHALTTIRLDASRWRFVDLRIDIPPGSFGSDAINPHTQYSNPVAILEQDGLSGIGASFTLGQGNEMICRGAEFIVSQLDGITMGELMAQGRGFYETLTNPLQLRWLSPNAGVPLMAAGLVVNTLIDAAAKQCGLPAWEYLARLPTELLLDLVNLRHLDDRFDRTSMSAVLDRGLQGIDGRCAELKAAGLPVYYTTWIGHTAETISEQIKKQHAERGITRFKIKIGPDIADDSAKIARIASLIPKALELCVDANQTLSLDEAKRWLTALSSQDVKWLEEPFAPDNIKLFGDLIRFKRNQGLSCEVVTGENCPNHYTGAALMDCGIDRFQADPCRMFGLIDAVLVCCEARIAGCAITPHAGGSALDELSPHIQLFNLARVRTDLDPAESLTENVGFCSKYFAAPTIVKNGKADTPQRPGLLVGLAADVVQQTRDYKVGVTWLAL
jgi:L-fuconate dehydratase